MNWEKWVEDGSTIWFKNENLRAVKRVSKEKDQK